MFGIDEATREDLCVRVERIGGTIEAAERGLAEFKRQLHDRKDEISRRGFERGCVLIARWEELVEGGRLELSELVEDLKAVDLYPDGVRVVDVTPE